MRMLHVILPSRIPMRRRLVNIILNLTQWPQAVISDGARATLSPQPVTAAKIPRHYTDLVSPVLRQHLVTIDIVDFLQPSATLYWYGGITIFAVLLVQSNTQRAMQFGS